MVRDIASLNSIANTLAHEMGHNVGFRGHLSSKCRTPPACKTGRCIMVRSSCWSGFAEFSQCTIDRFNRLAPGLTCLKNFPRTFFLDPVCGNGLKEKGEECDCGTGTECKNACCDWSTCKLRAHAQCAEGECCSATCKLKAKGALCRDRARNENFCTGDDGVCPKRG